MSLMEDLIKAKQALWDHVGFEEDYVVYAIEDRTNYFWSVDEAAKTNKFAESIDQYNSDGDYYEDEIYTQRFYSKHVYRGADFTMVFVDTHTDGNKFFAIYDNTKEVK